MVPTLHLSIFMTMGLSYKKGGLVITTSPPFLFYISIYPFPMQLVTPSVAPIAVSNEIKTLSTSFQFSFDIDILSV